MSTKKYTVFGDGGLQALVNQTKANKTAAAENTAAVEGLTTDLQQMSGQITDVLGEVEGCLNELDTVKADTEAVNEALATKADAEHTHNYAGSSSAGGAANTAIADANGNNIAETYATKAQLEANGNNIAGTYVTKAQLEEILSMLNFGFVADESEMETSYTAIFAAVEALETRLEGDS